MLGRQLLRSGSSVGANYRAVCRAKSREDFVSKMGTVLEGADAPAFWTELVIETGKSRNQAEAATAIMRGERVGRNLRVEHRHGPRQKQ